MHAVADDFQHQRIIQQPGADHADFAMVERSHGVAEMGEMPEAGGFRLEDPRGGGRGVGGGSDDADFRGLADQLVRTIHFGGQRDDPDWGDVMEPLKFAEIRRSDEFRVLGSGVFPVDERPLDMQAGGAADSPARPCRRRSSRRFPSAFLPVG